MRLMWPAVRVLPSHKSVSHVSLIGLAGLRGQGQSMCISVGGRLDGSDGAAFDCDAWHG